MRPRPRVGALALTGLLAYVGCTAVDGQGPGKGRVVVEADERLAPYGDALQTVVAFGVSEGEALGFRLPETVQVRARWKDSFPSFCLARNDQILFEVCSDFDLGPYFVADPWRIRFYKIRDLLASVLNMAMQHRYPVLADMIAATYLVPRLNANETDFAWPQPYDYNSIEGPDGYVKELWSADLVEQCPDLDLAVVGQLVVEEHGMAAFCRALRAACDAKPEPGGEIAALADALVEVTGDQSLRERLQHAADLHEVHVNDDGALPLYAFDAPAEMARWFCWHAEVGFVEDSPLGEGGALCWVKTGDDTSWPALLHQLPYWRYRDWRGFGALECDVYAEAEDDLKLLVQVFDGPRRVNGVVARNVVVPPNERVHVVVPLRFLRPEATDPNGDLFDGTFAFEDVEGIALVLWPSGGPATVYVDSLKLTPGPTSAVGSLTGGQHPPNSLTQASELLNEATRHQVEGDLAEAERIARQAVTLAPDFEEAHWVLARLLVARGKEDEAREHFLKVKELAETDKMKEIVDQILKDLK